MVDMPLEELLQYGGSTPCPADFNAYWQQGLEEMRNVNPRVERTKASFQVPSAKCYDLWFTGVRGARVHAKCVIPANLTEPGPAVLCFHGYAGSSGDWCGYLRFTALGYTVVAMDCRGQGGLSQDNGSVCGNTLHGHIIRGLDGEPNDLYYRQVFLDTALLAGIVADMPLVDETRIATEGMSQGGGLALVCAALEPRVALVACQMPFLCDYRRVLLMNVHEMAYEEIHTYFRCFDPQHKREHEIFERLGYIDVQNFTSRIRGEVLFGSGLMDTGVPPSTQFAAYNKITSKKHLEVYPDYNHECFPGFADKVVQFLARDTVEKERLP